MKGVVVDVRTGEIKYVDDGLPVPPSPNYPPPVDIVQLAEQVAQLEVRLRALAARSGPT